MARAPHGDIARRVDATGQTWFDGKDAVELLLRGFDITGFTFDNDATIAEYNAWCDRLDKADRKIIALVSTHDPRQRANEWWIEEPYQSLDVRSYVLARCRHNNERARVIHEMDMYEQRNLLPLLRLMIMLVDHFRANKIVWGVGRGSSVASYVLFLIGIHKIDSLYYGLDIEEFLR